MKRILITGANSYIGTSFEKYISDDFADEYSIETVDMIDSSWRGKPFEGFDTIFHVAGIVHVKETKKNAHMYYEVNRDLPIEVATKAKREGVKQFVFLSTMSVYGMDNGIITRETIPNPKNNYGKSKLEAEEGLLTLQDDSFHVAIIRPPMVYGDGCKGNYQYLVNIARKIPVCPTYKNQKSLISIKNLICFVKHLADKCETGIFMPQDMHYVCTSDMIFHLAQREGRKIKRTGLLNPLIAVLVLCTVRGKKAFGNLTYLDFDCVERTK